MAKHIGRQFDQDSVCSSHTDENTYFLGTTNRGFVDPPFGKTKVLVKLRLITSLSRGKWWDDEHEKAEVQASGYGTPVGDMAGPPLIPRGIILTVDSYSGAYVYAKGPNQMGGKMPFFVVTFETFTERVQE
jgi:hypothetical protein